MKLKNKLTALAAAVLVSVPYFANAQGIDTPFKPTATLIVSLENTNVWAELYSVPFDGVADAINKAKDGHAPAETLTAAIAEWSLHLTSGKKSLILPEQEFNLTRDAVPIDYADCVVTPSIGDRLNVKYEAKDKSYTAVLDVEMREYLAYGSDSDELLDVKDYEQCMKETHSRMFLHGDLTLFKKGSSKPFAKQDVLVQSIAEPN